MTNTTRRIPRRGKRRHFTALGTTVVVLIYGCAASTVPAVARSFCDGQQVVDYARPFGHMPSVRLPPVTGRLPFAPKVRLDDTRGPGIETGPGSFGYLLSYASESARRTHLEWQVSGRLIAINRQGRAIGVIGTRTRTIHVLPPNRFLSFGVKFSSRTHFYRYDFVIRRLHGRRLAKYSQYLRVLPPRFVAQLRLSVSNSRPGGDIMLRVANLGTQTIVYGEDLRVEVFDGTTWTVTSSFPKRADRRISRRLQAGFIGGCIDLPVPSGAPPGRYRLAKRVSVLRANGRLGRHRDLRTEVTITP